MERESFSRRDLLSGGARLAAGALAASLPLLGSRLSAQEAGSSPEQNAAIRAIDEIRAQILEMLGTYKARIGNSAPSSPQANELAGLAEQIFRQSFEYGQMLAEFERANPKFGHFFRADDKVDPLLRALEESDATAAIPESASAEERARIYEYKNSKIEDFISRALELLGQDNFLPGAAEPQIRFYRGFLCGYYEHLCPPSN